MCFLRFLAIISNLLVKLKTFQNNEFCLCPYMCIMGIADATFVTAVPKLVVCRVCAGFFLTMILFCDLQMTLLWLLSISFTELITYPWFWERRLHMCVLWVRTTGAKRAIGYWCDHSVVFAQKWCFIRAPKVSVFFRFGVIHLQHLRCGSSISEFELLAGTKLQIMNLSPFYLQSWGKGWRPLSRTYAASEDRLLSASPGPGRRIHYC